MSQKAAPRPPNKSTKPKPPIPPSSSPSEHSRRSRSTAPRITRVARDSSVSARPLPSNSSPFFQEQLGECSICNDDGCLLANLSIRCEHSANVCVTCLRAAIVTDVTSKGQNQFRCPSANCEVWFEPNEYHHLLDRSLNNHVEKLLLYRMLEKDEEFRWCKSSKGCGAGQLVSNHKDLVGYYACYACEEMMCYRHSIQWHNGYTCDEYDLALAENPGLASDTVVLQFCKQCPNEKCKTPIMKHEGCDVITCCQFGTHTCAESKGKCDHGGQNYCGQRFCWKCLGKIDIDPTSNAFMRHCKEMCEYASLN